MRLSIWVMVLVAVVFVSAAGCGKANKPVTPEEQQKIDDDMKKAMDQNKKH